MRHRRGFTLVEMLVVVSILLLLTLIAVSVFNATAGGDRMRSAARIAQSAFLGARDRASHAKSNIGLRPIRDPSDDSLAVAFIYIAPMPPHRWGRPVGSGRVWLERADLDGDGVTELRRIHGLDSPPWADYAVGQMFSSGQRLRMPADGLPGPWVPWRNLTDLGGGEWRVEAVVDPTQADNTWGPVAIDEDSTRASVEFEMANMPLTGHQPINLPAGVVVDLDWSTRIPSPPAAIDVMFSPGGAVTGSLGPGSLLHFLLNDIRDASQNLNPIDAANAGEKLVLTIFPQTGHVATFPIDPTDVVNNSTGAAGPDGLADDLFRFAKQGSVAGQ